MTSILLKQLYHHKSFHIQKLKTTFYFDFLSLYKCYSIYILFHKNHFFHQIQYLLQLIHHFLFLLHTCYEQEHHIHLHNKYDNLLLQSYMSLLLFLSILFLFYLLLMYFHYIKLLLLFQILIPLLQSLFLLCKMDALLYILFLLYLQIYVSIFLSYF